MEIVQDYNTYQKARKEWDMWVMNAITNKRWSWRQLYYAYHIERLALEKQIDLLSNQNN